MVNDDGGGTGSEFDGIRLHIFPFARVVKAGGSVRKRVDETPVPRFRKRAPFASMLVGGKLTLIPTDQLFPLLLSPKASVFEGIMDSSIPHIFRNRFSGWWWDFPKEPAMCSVDKNGQPVLLQNSAMLDGCDDDGWFK